MKIIALDVGGTSIKSVLWQDGQMSEIKETETEADAGGAFVLQKMCSILESYGKCDGIGISTTGQVNSEDGILVYANENMPAYSGIEIGPILKKRFHVPVAVENDVNAAAIGEGIFGAAREYRDYLCLTYGTGVGGAIVIDKKIYRGFTGAAGEVGSMVISRTDKNGEQRFSKEPKERGYYEDYASTGALIRSVQRIDGTIQNGRQLFQRMEEAELKKAIDEWVFEISHGLVSLIHIFNPSCILLGGGVMNQNYLITKISEVTKSRIMPNFKNVNFCKAELGNGAGLWGMIHLAKQKIKTV